MERYCSKLGFTALIMRDVDASTIGEGPELSLTPRLDVNFRGIVEPRRLIEALWRLHPLGSYRRPVREPRWKSPSQ
jgi:hypothetical protein